MKFPDFKVPEIAGSCDGLVCLAIDEHVVVWNPTTRECRQLPSPCSVPYDKYFYGLGYDSTSGDYKVLRGAYFADANDGSAKRIVEIFALRTDAWRKVQDVQMPEGLYSAGAFCNGSVYWLVRRAKGEFEVNAIASFDLTEEKFYEGMIPQPDVDQGMLFEGLRIHRGCLMLYYGHWDFHFQAWTMTEYGGEVIVDYIIQCLDRWFAREHVLTHATVYD
ncbi:hypothetical protein CDL15_Pgr026408 [Punica granatum]|nr:hypothetical protein CDL15_Pgr026408 [Punica granatum]